MRLLALLDSASAAASGPSSRLWLDAGAFAWASGGWTGHSLGLVHVQGVLAWHRLRRAFQAVPGADSQGTGD